MCGGMMDEPRWLQQNYYDGLREAKRLILQNGNVQDALSEIDEALQKSIPTQLSDSLSFAHRKDPVI
jgi:hypothetical protein